MKECGQPRSQGSFSSWNGMRQGAFAALEVKRELKPKCVPLLFLKSLLGSRRSAISQ